MTRVMTSKSCRRQHRGVIPPKASRPAMETMEQWIARLQSVKVVVSSRFASRYDRTVNMLGEYQAEHNGEMPPNLYDILGEEKPVDIWADIVTGMEKMRQDRMKAITHTAEFEGGI